MTGPAADATTTGRQHTLPAAGGDPVAAAFSRLLTVLAGDKLNHLVGPLEHQLLGVDAGAATAAVHQAGIDAGLLTAALIVRRDLGRINDLIHACAIGLSLTHILEPGEVITQRPSLAAGNDPARRYDLETDRRVAEFKLAAWKGSDAMRKRGVFQDLVHLAAADRSRRAELYVVGPTPIRFLTTSNARAAWALDKSPATQAVFTERFGSLTMTVATFTSQLADHVRIIDLADLLPEIAAIL